MSENFREKNQKFLEFIKFQNMPSVSDFAKFKMND